jgi:hypothetical protein
MRIFLGLIVAPSLALACQGVMLALVSPACSDQTRIGLHVVAALFLVATVLLALASARGAGAHGAEGPLATRRFLGACATAVAALSALVILMMWVAAWVLSPCS